MKKTFLMICLMAAFAGCQHTSRRPRPISIDFISMTTRDENSFKGIVEAFRHRETKGGRVFLRTDPEKRAGLYFSINFNHTIGLLPIGSKFVLHFITNANPKPETVVWVLPKFKHSLLLRNELYLGITDDDHYAQKNLLIAWKLEILHPDGHVIAHKESLSW